MNKHEQKDCVYCPTNVECFFEEVLPAGQVDELQRQRKLVDLAKGETLFLEGSEPHGLWMVCRGRIKVFRQGGDGKPLITRIAQAGEMVGYRSFFAGQSYCANAEAMEASTVFYVRRQNLEQLIHNNGSLALYFLHKLATELEEAEAATTEMAYHGAGPRVLAALRRLQKIRSAADRAREGRSFPIRRQDLAELAGLTVETTVRVLKKLERDGVLVLKGKRVSFSGEVESIDIAH